ncbi:hypothetical protein HW555_002914, partial [Spodoptera exigua]
ARDNGIILLQLPGHTTHRPLDVSFFKPFNGYYAETVKKWLRANPGQSVTQYQISALINESYGRAASVANAQSGFRATGIWPTNRNIFKDCDFLVAETMNTNAISGNFNDIESAGASSTNFTDQLGTTKEANPLVPESTTTDRTASEANSSKEIIGTKEEILLQDESDDDEEIDTGRKIIAVCVMATILIKRGQKLNGSNV